MNFFNRIYVINLKCRPERWEYSYNQLISNGFLSENITRINAVDSHELYQKNRDYLKTILSKDAFVEIHAKKRDSHEQLSVGAIGCALSHISVWRDMVKYNIPGAFVFEDDIQFCKDFQKNFEKRWTHVPSDWNLVFLGCRHVRKPKKINKHVKQPLKLMLTHAYIINTRGAEILLKDVFPLTVQIDAYMTGKFDFIDVYALTPSLVFQKGNKYFKTDIQIPLKKFHHLRALLSKLNHGEQNFIHRNV